MMKSRARASVVGKIAVGLLAGFLSVSSVAGTDGVAHAQNAAQKKPQWMVKQEAQNAYKEGKDKMGKGDYKAALEAFKKADELYPGAAPKYNIAVCYDELGMVKEAIEAYKTFIQSNPGDKYKTQVVESGKRISELEAKMMGEVTVKIAPENPSGLAIKVDGTPVEGTQLKLEPGEHTIEVSAEGHHPQTHNLNVEGGGTVELNVTLEPIAAAGPTPQPDIDLPPDEGDGDGPEPVLVAGFVMTGLTVVGGVLTTVFGVQALNKKSDFDATPTEELADDAENAALLSDVFLGVTAAVGVTAVVLLAIGLTGDGDEEAAADRRIPTLTPYAGPNGGGAAVTWTF